MSLRFDILMDEYEAAQMNAIQLAYLGDSVWELIVRHQLIVQKLNVNHMHNQCIKLVNAHSQSEIMNGLINILTSREMEIYQRGRNSHAKHPAPKNQNPEDYSKATGFEAILGYLYLTGQNKRIGQLIDFIRGDNQWLNERK